MKIWLLSGLLIATAPAALAQTASSDNELGMTIRGDDNSPFGLMINNWLNTDDKRPLAPGLIRQEVTPLDPDQQGLARQAWNAMQSQPRR